MASYTVSCDSTSVTFKVTGLSSGNIVRPILRPTSTSYLLYNVDFRASSSSLTVTIPDDLDSRYGASPSTYYDNGFVPINLTPGTEYICRVYVFDSAADIPDAIYDDLGAKYFTTKALPSYSPWSWTASNGPNYSATAAQTQKAYLAVANGGPITDFSYKVWNDLVYKANEIITSNYWEWDDSYATLSQTLMTSSDRVLTAKRFNSLRNNIGSHYGTGITEKSRGDPVMGSYFITIAAAMNKI